MEVFWTRNAENDLEFWKKNNPKIIERIKDLINSIKIDSFVGIGKPEALKYNLAGCWSRIITEENRLVYRAKSKNEIVILQCRYHYQ